MALSQAEGVKGSSVCAIYTHQSSNTHSDLTSCQMQFEACEAFIGAHKHNGWRWIEEHFNDEGWSGASLDRPALQRLLVKVRNGEIDRLLVYRLDRLSRSVVDSVSLLNEFRERGIDLVIVTAPEIGSTAHDSLILNLLSIFAEFERDLVVKRIADARAALKRRGRRVGGALPETIFSQVRAQLVSRRTRSPGRKERTEFWMLKRRIRCTRCGRIMSTTTTRHGSRIYSCYRCRSMNAGKNPCRKTQVPAGQI